MTTIQRILMLGTAFTEFQRRPSDSQEQAMARTFRTLTLLGAALLVQAACSSDGPENPVGGSPMPTPTPTPVTIYQGNDVVPSRVLLYIPFSTTAAGTITTSVDWTLAVNDIDVFLVRGNHPCSVEQFNAGQCSFLGASRSTTAKPERISVSNLGAGEYTVYAANFGASDDTLSVQITLTSGQSATASSTGTSATSSAIKGSLLRQTKVTSAAAGLP